MRFGRMFGRGRRAGGRGGGRGRGGGGIGRGGQTSFPIDPRDSAAIEALRGQSVDLSKPIPVRHSLTFVSAQAAQEASERLRNRGFDVQVDQPAGADPRPHLTATQATTLDQQAIADLRGRFTRFAERHGGEYEGWQAER